MTWNAAIVDFIDFPIFGKDYLIASLMTYPHNIYLETLMATGLIGVLFLLVPLFYLAFLVRKNTVENVGVYLLFLVALIAGMFSGSLFINPFFWSIVGVMIGFSSNQSISKIHGRQNLL